MAAKAVDQPDDRTRGPRAGDVAFLVAGGALDSGRQRAMFLTKDAVRLALPGVADGVACEGCPPLGASSSSSRAGRRTLVCPICFNAKDLDEAQLVDNARWPARLPLWEWIGEDTTTVFSY